MSEEEKKEITPAVAQNPQALALYRLGEDNPKFLEKYRDDIARVQAELPSAKDTQMMLDALPDEMADDLSGLLRKLSGKKAGIYSEDSHVDFSELKLFHGTGNDPNLPKDLPPGHFYMNTQERVGPEFTGLVLALWEGRTNWPEKDSGESTGGLPVCQSMNRIIGNTFGECDKCAHKPWRDGVKQRCADDIGAVMLTKDLKELVIVRFAKTSEPSGKRLRTLVKRNVDIYSKWYSLTTEPKTHPKDKNWRWYVINVTPVPADKGGYVDERLHPFCNTMRIMLEAGLLLPKIADTYASAERNKNKVQPILTDGGGSVAPISDSDYQFPTE